MACLGQLVPGLLLDTQRFPLSQKTLCRSNLASVTNNKISTLAQTNHTLHHSKYNKPRQTPLARKTSNGTIQGVFIPITIYKN
jgi:hypothetical protein